MRIIEIFLLIAMLCSPRSEAQTELHVLVPSGSSSVAAPATPSKSNNPAGTPPSSRVYSEGDAVKAEHGLGDAVAGRGRDIVSSALLLGAVVTPAGSSRMTRAARDINTKTRHIVHPPISKKITHHGRLEYVGDGDARIAVLYLTGSPYEMGYEHGRLLRQEVRETIANVEEGMASMLQSMVHIVPKARTKTMADAVLDGAYASMDRFVPQDKKLEMKGLADGSGLPLKEIQRMHAIPDIGETSCSNLVATASATRDGHVYQLRILDYGGPFKLYKHPLIIVYKPEQGNAYINIGWAGFIGVISGVNDKGLAIGEMGFGNPPGETVSGEPMPFVLEEVLRYANTADEAVPIVRRDQGTNSYIYFFGDKGGNGLGMVVRAEKKMSFRINEFADLRLWGESYPNLHDFFQLKDMIHAGHFEDKMTDLLRQSHGQLDVSSIQDLARQIAMKSNVHTVIYDLTDEAIWVANRTEDLRAVDRPYVPFSLREALSKLRSVN